MFELTITARRYNFVSVTRRSIRAPVQVPAPAGQKIVTVQGEYGVVFGVMAQILKGFGAIAIQF